MSYVPFLAQVVLLALWYTVAPGLPVWLVFLPAIICVFTLVVMLFFMAAAIAIGGLGSFK